MNLLNKIQNLPIQQRKIIFWSVMIMLSVSLSWFYIKNIQKRIKTINQKSIKEELQIPKLEEELKKLPKFEIPRIK